MDSKLKKIFERFKQRGLTPEQEQKMLAELDGGGSHDLPDAAPPARTVRNFYAFHDLLDLQGITALQSTPNVSIRSIDELLERDRQREKDGFPRKINVGRLIKPGKSGKDKVVIVPSTVEEKFLHDNSFRTEEEQGGGGSGDGEEGEVIGEQPVRAPDQQGGTGPGQGEGGQHEMESNAYDLGKILTEKFELPNLKDKGKKKSLTRYTYDLTDKHRGFGQLLDKKATLRKIVETNIHLGNVPDVADIDPSRFLVSPADLVYRILSREKDYESQAMVFFLRDYSGSMAGNSTVLVVAQHVLIYSWLLYQYAMQVDTRFILHDTEATEVPDFYTYYNSKVAGGTQVSSAYRLVNEIVEKENLVRDYNIYIFHGTDGDDWDTDGKESIPELKKMLSYANRVGITIAEHATEVTHNSEVEKYLKKSNLLEDKPKLLRLDVLQENANEPRLIEGIKHLISE
ncbi:MAG: DUF444 family protein [Desulfobacterales bacterium]|jgi:uncharacterized sporulation protein YeaH/YhbH (DUF444 family)